MKTGNSRTGRLERRAYHDFRVAYGTEPSLRCAGRAVSGPTCFETSGPGLSPKSMPEHAVNASSTLAQTMASRRISVMRPSAAGMTAQTRLINLESCT